MFGFKKKQQPVQPPTPEVRIGVVDEPAWDVVMESRFPAANKALPRTQFAVVFVPEGDNPNDNHAVALHRFEKPHHWGDKVGYLPRSVAATAFDRFIDMWDDGVMPVSYAKTVGSGTDGVCRGILLCSPPQAL